MAILLFADNRARLKGEYTKVLNAIQGAVGGPLFDTKRNTIFHDINHLFELSTRRLILYGLAIIIYAAINGIEAFGLWRARRWAEYLTLFEVSILLPIEIYELSIGVTFLKLLTRVLNLAIIVYLLVSHRLLGVRGGGAAARAEHDRDLGWPAVERATPLGKPVPVASVPPSPTLVADAVPAQTT